MIKKQRNLSPSFSGLAVRLLTAALLVFGAGAASAQTLAYVSDSFVGVHVLDTATNTVLETISIGGPPGALAASPNGAFVYVTDTLHETVSVIAVATNTVVARVAIPRPMRIAFSPDGAFAYVTSTALNADNVAELYVIDTAKVRVVDTIPIEQGLDGLAVTPDGASVWVASAETGEVYVVDTATNTVSATVGGMGDSRALAITPDGAFVYVTSAFSATLVAISTATQSVVAYVPDLVAFDVAIRPDSAFAYVPLLDEGDVAVVDTATNTVAATVPAGGNPAFVAITPDGALAYIADLDGQVRSIDTATNTVTDTVSVGIALADIDILVKPASPTTKAQCLNRGWATFSNPSFANQGSCIAYVNGL